jgi:DNA-directed RNA polymerase specialized sigma24 family protein
LCFKPLVERAIRVRLGRHNFPHTIEDIKDIAQGIFLDIWEENKLAQLKDEDKISGWLAIVAQNTAIDFIRRSKNLLRKDQRVIEEEGAGAGRIEQIPSASNPLKELTNSELADTIQILKLAA